MAPSGLNKAPPLHLYSVYNVFSRKIYYTLTPQVIFNQSMVRGKYLIVMVRFLFSILACLFCLMTHYVFACVKHSTVQAKVAA
jgi:hypothetical protein